ncbi:hypothetical protein [Clostridium sp. BL-8]|uniref:hypothetical protein n=1 Tax=Clostridium sp. BL-8 TaxID=349938 RepID=UPI00098C5DE4|nr:hypothetical protein [Clostridium sp. BL-8]OOM80734.1 hypothetical protein CLOBL_07670 [Clostridium sp. BL-8]
MIQLDIFNMDQMTDLDRKITKYVNSNVESIIRVLLDFLEDNNGFTPEDFLPYNNLRINNNTWSEMVCDLYDIIRSDVIREWIKPKYEYLLYVILQWWNDCNDSLVELLPNKLDDRLVAKIQIEYALEDGDNYVLNAITNFDEYYYILFADHDFLPENLERLVTIYLRNRKLYKMFFEDVDLNEYRDLMPKDLQEQFDEVNYKPVKLIKNNLSEESLLKDLLFCCERLQSNHSYKEAPEDNMNDFIRDLLTAMGYDLRDQTRQGSSSGDKQSGEVDLLVKIEKFPYSIIEALKLSSVNETYISEHIDKIYKYDTLGNSCNFIISYVKIKDFLKFWDKYILYTKFYNYPFELTKFTVWQDKQYSELKLAVAELNRNDTITELYHIAIHIPS